MRKGTCERGMTVRMANEKKRCARHVDDTDTRIKYYATRKGEDETDLRRRRRSVQRPCTFLYLSKVAEKIETCAEK